MFKQNRCQGRNSIYDEAVMFNNDQMYINQANENYIPNEINPCQRPIFEPIQERVCHKEIFHEVPHVCPINTRIINHHIYRHTYSPCYTYCEENDVCNIYDNCCNNF